MGSARRDDGRSNGPHAGAGRQIGMTRARCPFALVVRRMGDGMVSTIERASRDRTRATRWGRIGVSLVLMSALAACANQSPRPEDVGLGAPRNGKGSAVPGSARDFSVNVGDIVYFSTDSTDLTPEAQQTLSGQARWLQQYPKYTLMIEGHADERGTREYNIALGARRAQSVRDFLARNGIAAARVRTISYGKERPVAVCNDISCWSQNRRAQTVLSNRGPGS